MNRTLFLGQKKNTMSKQYIPYVYDLENARKLVTEVSLEKFTNQEIKEHNYHISSEEPEKEKLHALINIMLAQEDQNKVFTNLSYINLFIQVYYGNNNCNPGLTVIKINEIIQYLISHYEQKYASEFIEFINNVIQNIILNYEDRFDLFINKNHLFMLIINLELYKCPQVVSLLVILDYQGLITEDQLIQILFILIQYLYSIEITNDNYNCIKDIENTLYIISSIICLSEHFQQGLSFTELERNISGNEEVLTISKIKDQLKEVNSQSIKKNEIFYNNIQEMANSLYNLYFSILPRFILKNSDLPPSDENQQKMTIQNYPYQIQFSKQFLEKYYVATGIIIVYNINIYFQHDDTFKIKQLFDQSIQQFYNTNSVLSQVIHGLYVSTIADFVSEIIQILNLKRGDKQIIQECLQYLYENSKVIQNDQIEQIIHIYNEIYDIHVNAIQPKKSVSNKQNKDQNIDPPELYNQYYAKDKSYEWNMKQLVSNDFTNLLKLLANESQDRAIFIEEFVKGNYHMIY